MSEIEDRIRQKAHELWLEEGCPEGKETEHWFKASDIVRREIFEETVASPNPAAEAEDFGGGGSEPVEQAAREDRQAIDIAAGKPAQAKSGSTKPAKAKKGAKADTGKPPGAKSARKGSPSRRGVNGQAGSPS
jgi:hypothetical protein